VINTDWEQIYFLELIAVNMIEVVCPYCGINVSISATDSSSHICPNCNGEFEVENDNCEFSEFERELNFIDRTSNNKNDTERPKNKHTKNRKASSNQRLVSERFNMDIHTIKLTKFSALRILQSIFVFFYGHYLLLGFFLLGLASIFLLIMFPFMYSEMNNDDVVLMIIVLPIGVLCGWWSIVGIKDNLREFRRQNLFLHTSSNTLELTGRRIYGLGHHEVVYRTKLATETIVEPITVITEHNGEGGGISTSYGLIFDDNKSSWTFFSNPRELKSILHEIESRYNVKVLPNRETRS
jgi:predicted RNA-binding Zn-ribbon protein involved in translation (DUF1610 family)